MEVAEAFILSQGVSNSYINTFSRFFFLQVEVLLFKRFGDTTGWEDSRRAEAKDHLALKVCSCVLCPVSTVFFWENR